MSDRDSLTASPPDSPQIQSLLALHGIARDYINYAGGIEVISYENRLRILRLMGVDPAREPIDSLLETARTTAAGDWLPPAVVVRADQPVRIPLSVPEGEREARLTWRMTLESGARELGEVSLTDLPTLDTEAQAPRVALELPAMPAGYHALELDGGTHRSRAQLIATPAACFRGDWESQGRRLSGLSLHLYCLRSARNWGIGDFTDLEALLVRAARKGLDFAVLNPLHVLDGSNPDHCSPYSPTDRRFLNPLYLDLEREPDFREHAEAPAYIAKAAFQARLAELREAPLVDYRAVAHLKTTVLSKMYKHFRRFHLDELSERGRSFQDWVTGRGEALVAFGEFQANRQRLAQDRSREPEFHHYLQWLAEAQLERCQQRASEAGMAIGLVRDLAVGSDREGTEVRLNPGLFCPEASVGAPPDPLAPQGQNWGLPPIDPVALKQSGYQHFIELLRANMTHCGALRIDHIMSLMRLWWCPGQDHSGKGAYVSYPADVLFALLCLESQRNRCLVIGEDLGIVPPEIRRLMWESGVFSNRLFYFEKTDPIHFRLPRDYDAKALTMVANHDVPTLTAWWNRTDLALRDEIGLFDSPDDRVSSLRARESDLIQILHWLNEQGLLPENWRDFDIHRPFDTGLCEAIMRANGGSASQLVSIQPEDLCMMERPVNIPGTHTEYPNWRRKLSTSIEELFDGGDGSRLLTAFVAARKAR